VLFGIALQRAIEMTRDLLNPTLAARIALDCAMAMSRVTLPGEILEVPADAPAIQPAPAAPATAKSPAPSPLAAVLSGIRVERRRDTGDASVPNVWARMASRPAVTLLTIAFIGVMTVAGARWKAGRSEATAPVAVERKLQVAKIQPPTPIFSEPTQEAPPLAEPSPRQQAAPIPPPPPVAQVDDGPPPTAAEATEAKINEETQRQLDANATGDSEMVPIAEFAASPSPQPSGSIPAESLF
jgi:hypothetical protein